MPKTPLRKENVIERMANLWDLLTEDERNTLAATLNISHYRKNQVVYSEGDAPEKLFCLIEGKVKVYRNGVCQRSQIIRVIKPVQYFGYRAYLAGESEYITAAAAVEQVVIGEFPMDVVYDVLQQNCRLSMFFNKLMAIDLGIADRRTVSLTQKHTRGRLAESLLFLKENYGVEEDHSTLSIYLSREDLAHLSNMTTSNAIRTLTLFSQEKLITTDGRKIKIIDEEGLRRVSRIG